MATYYHNDCAASWQGNYNAAGANQNKPVWVTREITVTAAQAVSGNIFNLIKLDRNTIVLDGYLYAEGLDVNASTTALVDVGYFSDANGDGDTDNADYFVDGAVLPTLTGGIYASFFATAADGFEVKPFIPVDTLTSDDSINGGYFVGASLLGTVATAGVGTIKVGLLIAPKNGMTSAAE
jgi:hypothetical protein